MSVAAPSKGLQSPALLGFAGVCIGAGWASTAARVNGIRPPSPLVVLPMLFGAAVGEFFLRDPVRAPIGAFTFATGSFITGVVSAVMTAQGRPKAILGALLGVAGLWAARWEYIKAQTIFDAVLRHHLALGAGSPGSAHILQAAPSPPVDPRAGAPPSPPPSPSSPLAMASAATHAADRLRSAV